MSLRFDKRFSTFVISLIPFLHSFLLVLKTRKMKGVVLLILCAWAVHDHSEHLDEEFMRGEAMRLGQLGLTSIERHLNDYKLDLHMY